jgi:hypothetical protein
MATEVEQGGIWEFSLPQKDIDHARNSSMAALRARRLASIAEDAQDGANLSREVPPPQAPNLDIPPFMATPLHDFEGLFWMYPWTIDVRSFNSDNSSKEWQLPHYNYLFGTSGNKANFLKDSGKILQWIRTVNLGLSASLTEASGFYIAIAEALVKGYRMLESTTEGQLNHLAYSDQKTPREIVEFFSYLAELTDPIPLYGRISLQAHYSQPPTQFQPSPDG